MTEPPARLRVSGPGDLVSLAPFLVGFVPHDSLLVLWLSGGQIRLTGRIDLDAPRATLQETIRTMRGRLGGDADAVLIAWSQDAPRSRRMLRWAAAALPEGRVLDRIHTDGQRWWSLTCRDPQCCPRAGTPVEVVTDATRLAEAAGLEVGASRAEAVAAVAGPSPAESLRLRQHVVMATARHAEFSQDEVVALLAGQLVPELLATGELPDEAGLVELAVLASQSDLAAAAVAALTGQEEAARQARLWSAVVRTSPPEAAPGPLAILGIAAWVAGQGAITTDCCARLAGIDADHPLLPVLEGAVLGAWPPGVWDELRGRVAG